MLFFYFGGISLSNLKKGGPIKMKNVGKYVLVVLLSFFFTSSVAATGAISVKEQLILDELTQKLEVQGNEFQVPETYITQTENYLKRNDLAESQTLVVINNIRQAKSLIKNLDTDLSNVHSLDELIKRIPRDSVVELQRLITESADVLGLVVLSWNEGHVELGTQNPDGTTSAVFSSEQPIKQTGAVHISSFLAIGLLLLTATGAFIIGKKVKLA